MIQRSVPLPQGVEGGLGAAGQVQLAEDVADVGTHRRLANEQLVGDSLVAQPLCHQLQRIHIKVHLVRRRNKCPRNEESTPSKI